MRSSHKSWFLARFVLARGRRIFYFFKEKENTVFSTSPASENALSLCEWHSATVQARLLSPVTVTMSHDASSAEGARSLQTRAHVESHSRDVLLLKCLLGGSWRPEATGTCAQKFRDLLNKSAFQNIPWTGYKSLSSTTRSMHSSASTWDPGCPLCSTFRPRCRTCSSDSGNGQAVPRPSRGPATELPEPRLSLLSVTQARALGPILLCMWLGPGFAVFPKWPRILLSSLRWHLTISIPAPSCVRVGSRGLRTSCVKPIL